MKGKTTIFYSVLFVSLMSAVHADDFKTPAARIARKEYEAKVASVQAEAEKGLLAARREYLARLKIAEREATRAGDLDEAVRIRAEATEARKQEGSPVLLQRPEWQARLALASRLADTTWLPSKPGAGSHFTLVHDGSVLEHVAPGSDRPMGNWAPLGEHTAIIVNASPWINVCQFNEDCTAATLSHAFLQEGSWGERKEQAK